MADRTISAPRMRAMIQIVSDAVAHAKSLPFSAQHCELTGRLMCVQEWLLQAACVDVTVETERAP